MKGSTQQIRGRELIRDEVEQVWSIDRSEIIENLYYYENSKLVLRPAFFHMKGWPSGEAAHYTPILLDCFDRGGWFYGLFDGDKLIGIAILESKWIGAKQDQLQLKFLHVSHGYRGQGWGRKLFRLAQDQAREMGAKRLYISATPSEHTIDFYRSLGCMVTNELDPELYELEPEDIHLECPV